jgi:nucleoside-diphosphate-sugar epimerase
LAFATGVSDSACTSDTEFARECALLYEVLEDARSAHAKIVYFSGGGALYGRWDRPAIESGPLEPRSQYGRHQLFCEGVVAAAGVSYLVVRLPNVVSGGANPHQLIPNIVAQVLEGQVHVQSRAQRDLIDAADLGPVVVELLGSAADRDVVNVATGISVDAPTIVSEICAILGASPSIIAEDRGESQHFDTAHLRQILGRDPFANGSTYRELLRRYVPQLAEGLTKSRV